MLLRSEFSPLSHSQIPGLFARPKISALGGPTNVSLEQQHFLLGAEGQCTGKIGRNHALAFLRNSARDQNLFQCSLAAQMAQTNTEEVKRLACRTLAVREHHKMSLRRCLDVQTFALHGTLDVPPRAAAAPPWRTYQVGRDSHLRLAPRLRNSERRVRVNGGVP